MARWEISCLKQQHVEADFASLMVLEVGKVKEDSGDCSRQNSKTDRFKRQNAAPEDSSERREQWCFFKPLF